MPAPLHRASALLLSALLPFSTMAAPVDTCAADCGLAAPLPTSLDAQRQLLEFALLLPKLQQITTACAVPRAALSVSHDKLQRAPCYLA